MPTPTPRACSVTRRNTPRRTPRLTPRRTRRRTPPPCRVAVSVKSRRPLHSLCPCITQRFIRPNQLTALPACICQGTEAVGIEQVPRHRGLAGCAGPGQVVTDGVRATRRQWFGSSATREPRDRQGRPNNQLPSPAESAFMQGELPSSDQAVAHAADCLDAVAADLGTQVADIHPDHVRTWVEIEPPNAAE